MHLPLICFLCTQLRICERDASTTDLLAQGSLGFAPISINLTKTMNLLTKENILS